MIKWDKNARCPSRSSTKKYRPKPSATVHISCAITATRRKSKVNNNHPATCFLLAAAAPSTSLSTKGQCLSAPQDVHLDMTAYRCRSPEAHHSTLEEARFEIQSRARALEISARSSR
uniref:Uncharacterized protein n=1 Tax=Steinernema glaseri TaxID=37863 RepID=A0A1I8A5C1_9BILA